MIRKSLLLVAALLALWFGGRALFIALASPQKKIRWRLEEMVEGFNEMRMDPVLGGIAPGFVDRTSGITREELRQTLTWMFLNETDQESGFLWRAELDADALSIALGPEEESADVTCHLRVFQRRGEEFTIAWDARLAGRFALTDDGWRWTELTEANHAERRRH